MSLVYGEQLPSPFPLATGNTRIDRYLFSDFFDEETYDPAIDADRLYLSACLLGSVGYSGSTIVGREFEDILRAFYGGCIALDLVSSNWAAQHDKKVYLAIHLENEDRPILAAETIDSDIHGFRYRTGTDGFVDQHGSGAKEALEHTLTRLSVIFGDNSLARRLFTACIWYFRSETSNRPLDQLLEATIAIEVLLGDRETSESVGISRLLGNRCAYLLGRSAQEREIIIDEFIKIYRLRSSIVHSGKHRLEANDRKIVSSARSLGGRIIAREMSLALNCE